VAHYAFRIELTAAKQLIFLTQVELKKNRDAEKIVARVVKWSTPRQLANFLSTAWNSWPTWN